MNPGFSCEMGLSEMLSRAERAWTKAEAQDWFDRADARSQELGTHQAWEACARMHYRLTMRWG